MKNLTAEQLMVNEEVRKDTLQALKDGSELRQSDIWNSTGNKFETVCGVYMTNQQVATFFGVTIRVIKTYMESERHGKVNEYRQELIGAGTIAVSNKECKEMVENFMQAVGLHENSVAKYENDTSASWKINSRGAVLYSLEAVCKLGMESMKIPCPSSTVTNHI